MNFLAARLRRNVLRTAEEMLLPRPKARSEEIHFLDFI